jgi:Xaa-Pro aminopeptidase
MTNGRYPEYSLVPSREIYDRIERLQKDLAKTDLCGALILDRLNMYYYTGTMQQGVVFVPTEGAPVFLVRRSFERATLETPIKTIIRLKGFSMLRGTLEGLGLETDRLGLDETAIPVSVFRGLSQAFPGAVFEDISSMLAMIRAVKSDYEVGLIREAGKRHEALFDAIPSMIREGMTEWELGSAIHSKMLAFGYTGIGRLCLYGGELFMGVVSFGESGNYPTASVGPGGLVGLCPAFPLVGGEKRLKKGDPIFVDTGFGWEGYYTDKTRVFALGRLSPAAEEAHAICLEVQEAVRCRLKPGAVPARIFEQVYREVVVPRGFEENFMGFGSNQVPFLGHGIGLAIDEFPAIAKKVETPLKANMVIAVEPKKGLEGVGLVGVENTFLVTEQGGEKLTPGADEIKVL